MYKIKYGINLNDHGRPVINLPEDYIHRAEDKFLSIELTRYILGEVYVRKSSELDNETSTALETTIKFLGQIGDNIAEILYEQMKFMGDMAMNIDCEYHIQVISIEERNNLPEKNIVFDDKIFDRFEGLRVCTNLDISRYRTSDLKRMLDIYELKGGITNEHWVKLNG